MANANASIKPNSRKVEQMLEDSPPAPGQSTTGNAADSGNNKGQQGEKLPLPHERDQSVGADATGGMGSGAAGERQREVMDQAHQDLKQGQVDTDMRATPGLDAAQRKQLVSDPKATPAPRGSVADHAKADRKR